MWSARATEAMATPTNVAMQLAASAGLPARAVAEVLAPLVGAADGVAKAEVAGPGFLNITLESAAIGSLARDIVLAGDTYGRTDRLGGLRLNLEFVSANPTGPVHIGGARWAVVGDVLARLLETAGADVSREYYFNDAGVQIDRFARSLFASAQGSPVPEDGYSGTYIAEIAAAVLRRRPDVLTLPESQALAAFRAVGTALMFDEIKASLAAFGTRFDVYFNEKDLHDQGDLDAAVARLREGSHVFERRRRRLLAVRPPVRLFSVVACAVVADHPGGGPPDSPLAAAASLAHDVLAKVVFKGRLSANRELADARTAIVVVGVVAVVLAIVTQRWNRQVLISFTFAAAASALLPIVLYGTLWRGFTVNGLRWALYGGLLLTAVTMAFSRRSPATRSRSSPSATSTGSRSATRA
ncbi:Cation/acetate symporter ActP [Streptomyces antimycoticus]